MPFGCHGLIHNCQKLPHIGEQLLTVPQDAIVSYCRDSGLDSLVFWPPAQDAVSQTHRFIANVNCFQYW